VPRRIVTHELIGSLSDAIEVAMNNMGECRALPPMHWSLRRDGEVGGHPRGADDLAVAGRWAVALGLDDPVDEMGARCWRGRVDAYAIEVWAVVDTEAWAAVGGGYGVG
jgi:hypothetical protein